MTDKCQARWGDMICSTRCICTWIVWWGQMLIQYGCRCRKKRESTQTLKPSATKVQRLQGRLSFPSYWFELLCGCLCGAVLRLSHSGSPRGSLTSGNWSLLRNTGFSILMSYICSFSPWWWMLLVLLALPRWIIKMRLPQLHRVDELVTPCPTH